MFFRNLTMFRFPKSLQLDQLAEALARVPLKPVGPMEMSSRGFVPPFGRATLELDGLAHTVNGRTWITLGGEDRILPTATVEEELAKKMDEFQQKNGRRPGGKMRRQLKEDLVTELLPRAFVRPMRIDACLDVPNRAIYVNTTSRKAAESAISHLREALGSFPALPVNAEVAVRSLMTGWLAGDAMPEGLSLGDACELRDPADSGAVVKVQRMELAGEEIESHLEAGKQVSRLALVLEDRVSFTLGEDLVIRQFKLLDAAVEGLESNEREDIRAELDARFALMAGEIDRLFKVLRRALKISQAD